jgi:FixJ family two-component response regulator
MSMPLNVIDIVDGDVSVLRNLGRVLSSHGYRACMYASAEQYRRTVDEGLASCVIIDTGLRGGLSGLDLGRVILSSRCPTPVIFISSSADPELREQAHGMGCVAYLEKPVCSEALIAAILESGASSS